jgi:hypothetical protein
VPLLSGQRTIPAFPIRERGSAIGAPTIGGPAAVATCALIVAPNPLTRLRRIALSLPEAHEVEAWGEPTFRVRNKLIAMYAAAGNHHGDGRTAVWIKATRDNQTFMVRSAPTRFFVPPYVGPSGWVGVYLDEGADWMEVAELLRDAYRLTAPGRLAARLDAPPAADASDRRRETVAPKRRRRERG